MIDDDVPLEELLAEADEAEPPAKAEDESENWDQPLRPLQASTTPKDPLAALPFTDSSGRRMEAVPQNAREVTLLERFAEYDEPVRNRLMEF